MYEFESQCAERAKRFSYTQRGLPVIPCLSPRQPPPALDEPLQAPKEEDSYDDDSVQTEEVSEEKERTLEIISTGPVKLHIVGSWRMSVSVPPGSTIVLKHNKPADASELQKAAKPQKSTKPQKAAKPQKDYTASQPEEKQRLDDELEDYFRCADPKDAGQPPQIAQVVHESEEPVLSLDKKNRETRSCGHK